jgi:endonuclease/exonuclease/phosphatase (EEP) superfamily protein YafD
MFALLYEIAVLTFAAALAVVTLLPLSASRAWWVRMWDFPRVHLAAGFGLVALASLALPGTARLILLALAAAGGGYQLWRIRPYTRLARREMEFAPDAPDGITLLTANVLKENTDHARLAAMIERSDPDVLFLMETDLRWIAALEPVLARYPTVLREPRDDHYGLVFATRLTTNDARVVYLTRDETPSVLAEMIGPGGQAFRFVGLHPQPPIPGQDTEERDAQITYAARFARRSGVPIVAMGDFNEAAWSDRAQHFKRVGGYVDPRVGRGLFASFNANHPLIRCPIDQIYVSAEIAMVSFMLLPPFGSDHLALLARIRVDPALAGSLNKLPPPPDPDEEARLDAEVEAFGKALDASREARARGPAPPELAQAPEAR